jgi:hypothetical protein
MLNCKYYLSVLLSAPGEVEVLLERSLETTALTCGDTCRRITAQVQLEQRSVSPVRSESMVLNCVVSSREEHVAPKTQLPSVVEILEDSYAKQSRVHCSHIHRLWGSWAGASQDGPHARYPFESHRDTSSNHNTAVLAGEPSCVPSPRYSEVNLRQEGSVADDSGGEGELHQLKSVRHTFHSSKCAQGRVSSTAVEEVSQGMSEAAAWEIVAQWKRVMEAAEQFLCRSQRQYAMDPQMQDVTNLPLTQRKELAARCGFAWKSILRLQDLKSNAELVLLSAHMGLVTKVCRPLQHPRPSLASASCFSLICRQHTRGQLYEHARRHGPCMCVNNGTYWKHCTFCWVAT